MSTASICRKNWTWTAEVLDFARKAGVEDYLDPMMEAAHRLFPTAKAIRAVLDNDPEIAGDTHIAFEVETTIRDTAEYRSLSRAWGDEVFRTCPAPLVCVFRQLILPVK